MNEFCINFTKAKLRGREKQFEPKYVGIKNK